MVSHLFFYACANIPAVHVLVHMQFVVCTNGTVRLFYLMVGPSQPSTPARPGLLGKTDRWAFGEQRPGPGSSPLQGRHKRRRGSALT